MASIAVRCPECREEQVLRNTREGATVTCPLCRTSYIAHADPTAIASEPASRTILLGLSLLPFAMPLLWLAAPFVFNTDPIFSVAVPFALAICVSGLCIGVSFTHDWSQGWQLKIILTLIGFGFIATGLLYVTKKDWVEFIRRQVGHGELEWREYRPADSSFRVRGPGLPVMVPDTPIEGWKLDTVKFTERKRQGAKDTFLVAFGKAPAEFAKLTDEVWFEKMKGLIAPESVGELKTENPVKQQGYPGREYGLELTDGGTNRAVRVVRVKAKVFVLVAEGAFLPPDHSDVRKFFESFYLEPGR